MADLTYDVSLAGRSFVVSRKGGRFGRRSIPLQKDQQDQSDLPGEQSLNPDDLWRRSFESWHRGAGQESFDRKESDPFRFRDSVGVDPWERYKMRLLADTDRKLASTATNVVLVVAGGFLYCGDGQVLRYTATVPNSGLATWTTVTGTPAAAITGMATDGYTVWIAFGTEGIYSTVRGAATATQYSFLDADILGFAKGRLMTSRNQSVYNVTGTSAPVAFRSQYQVGWFTVSSISPRSVAVPMPAGIEAGDLLILNVVGFRETTTPGSATISVTGDWTFLDSTTFEPAASARQLLCNTYFKVASASESAVVVTTTHSTTADFSTFATVLAYDGANIVGPIDVHAQATTTSSTSVSAGSVTTPADESKLVFIGHALRMGSAAGTSFTPPAGYTERNDVTWYGSTDSVTATVADKTQTVAGASGTVTAIAANTVHSIGHLISIRPNVPLPLTAHPNTDFRWVGFAEGLGHIYAAGYSGDKSLIYRTVVTADGSSLDAPVVAGRLPDGEIIRSIYGYLGLLFIGTDNGIRLATQNEVGNLTIGALIATPAPVRCFEGQGQYVWFGYEDFAVSRWASGTYDGIGRIDPTQITGSLVPAYASDLMVTSSTLTTEQVQSIVTFGDRLVFSIGDESGLSRGVYAATDQKVAAGYLDSGLVTYGISDTKVATYLDVRHKALVGTIQAFVSTDEGTFTSVGTSTVAGSKRPAVDPMAVGPSRGDNHEVRVLLSRASSSDAVGPMLTRATLRSEPAPHRGRVFQVPLVLNTKLDVSGRQVSIDPAETLTFIEGLFDTQTLVPYIENGTTFQVFVKDYEFISEHRASNHRSEQGICTVTLKVPSQ